MSCPTVIRVTTAQGPPGIGLPAGGADAGKFVRKAGSTPYAYELVTPDAIGLQQDLAPTSAPVFAGLTLSGLAANGLLFTGTGGALTRLPLGAGLAIVGGALTATGGGGSGSVTSVGLSAPTGFSTTGAITTSGNITLSFSTGYSLPTDARQADWDAAFTQRRTWDGGDQHLNAATGRASLQLGTAAQAAATDFATAAQGTLAATAIQPAALAGYVQTSDARLTDAREWSAATIDQAEAEGGTATTRRAFTAQRVRQAIAAWWGGYASSVGQALATAIDAAAGRTAIGAEQAGAAAAAQAFALQRGNHTGTQPASTITGIAAVATSGAYADLSGRFDPASPGAIGGTTPAAGTFTAGAFTQSILLPGTAPGTPAAGHLYRVVNTLRYRDSGAAEQLLLNATDNLASLADPAAALANIGGMPRTIEFTDLAYAATINIDFAAYNGRFVSIGTLTGNLSITFSNIVRGRQATVMIVSDSSLRTITYPGATPFGGIKQTTLSPSKRMFVSFTVYGSGGGDVDVWVTALPQL